MILHGGLSYMADRWERAAASPETEAAIHVPPTPGTFEESGFDFAQGMLNAVPAAPWRHVLEFGCGNGRVTQHLAEQYGTIYAADISPTMLEKLRARRLPCVIPVLTNGADLADVLGDRVHAVYSSIVLQHNRKADVHRIFHSFRAILHPGEGGVAFQLPVYAEGCDAEDWRDTAVWTRGEVEDLARETGFQVERLWSNAGIYKKGWPGVNHFALHIFRV
jgi:trans-aconitate methyltransferase